MILTSNCLFDPWLWLNLFDAHKIRQLFRFRVRLHTLCLYHFIPKHRDSISKLSQSIAKFILS